MTLSSSNSDTTSSSSTTASGVTTTTTQYKRTTIGTNVNHLPQRTLRVSGTNSRYLVINNSTTPIFLTGFHTWYNVQNGGNSNPPSAFNWQEYIDALVSYGCNFTKLWALESTRLWADPFTSGFNPQYFGIHRYVRTGPGNAADGELKFDLTQINPTYLDVLYDRVGRCDNNGIYCVVQLFQGWHIERKGGTDNPFTYHPYRLENNINSVDGDNNNDGDGTEMHTDSGNNVLSYQQALVTAIIDKLNNYDNIIWEVSNEDTGSTANTNWQNDMIDFIRNYELTKPKQHLIGMTKQWPNENDTTLTNSNADWVSYGNRNSTNGTKVSFSDTDHIEGITSNYQWIWESLCNGHGGAWYMDEWDGALYGTDRRNNSTYTLIRSNLGYALTLFQLLKNPLLMTPQSGLCSTGFCLARNHATAAEFICFQSGSGAFTLNLSTTTGTKNIRWLQCSNGNVTTSTTSSTSSTATMTPPTSGAFVLYVYH